nr:hypothetical protein [uncultured Dongia sp.]
MTDPKHPWRGRGLGTLLHTTITCASCGKPAIWSGSAKSNQLWARMRKVGTVEEVLAKLKCDCGGRANKIEFDLSPPEMGLSDRKPSE